MLFSKYRNPDRFSYLKDIFNELENSLRDEHLYSIESESVEYRRSNKVLFLEITRYTVSATSQRSGIDCRYSIEYFSETNIIVLYKYNDKNMDDNYREKIATLMLLKDNTVDISCTEENSYELKVLNSIYMVYDRLYGDNIESIEYALRNIYKYIDYIVLSDISKEEEFKTILKRKNLDNKSFYRGKSKDIKLEINRSENNIISLILTKGKDKLNIEIENMYNALKYTISINNSLLIEYNSVPNDKYIILNTIKKNEIEKIYNMLTDILSEYIKLYKEYLVEIGKGEINEKRYNSITNILE